MTAWTSDELEKIGAADELQLAVRRRDGSLRPPVPIWMARVGDSLYVRSVNGRDASWFRAVLATHEGRGQAGGVERDVTFNEPADGIGDQLDAAYRAKYGRYPARLVDALFSPAARSATIEVVPRPPVS
jgi:hypothetical protein